MVLELRPAHDPRKQYGFVGVVVSTADLTASVWLWERGDDGNVSVKKVIEIPPEPAEEDLLPPALKPFGAVPPLITDIDLSVDDRDLSCRAGAPASSSASTSRTRTTRARRARCGSAASWAKASHPAAGELNGGPQMVEISRDGRRVYLTNSLYAAWDEQFYPAGIDGWLVRLDAPEGGGLSVDPDLFVEFDKKGAAAPGEARGRRRVVGLVLLPQRLSRWRASGHGS